VACMASTQRPSPYSPAAAGVGNRSWLLAVRAAGNAAAVERYEHEVAPMSGGVALEGHQQDALWRYIQEFTLTFLAQYP